MVVAIFFGCKEKKPEVEVPKKTDSVAVVDTVPEVVIDTVPEDAMDSLISATPMPVAADELFDDFLFNFAANKKLQYERVDFPLQVSLGDTTTTIQQNEWKQEHYFMKQEFYTLIFDDEKQLDLVKATHLDSVVVEKIDLRAKSVEQHIFNRINGQWRLTGISKNSMFQNPNKSFLSFYEKFANDSVFQIQSIGEPVEATLPDPDDEYSVVEGEFFPEQWPEFRPTEMPADFLYNINYGQTYSQNKQKVLVFRGIANGLEARMTFRLSDGKWKLVKLVN